MNPNEQHKPVVERTNLGLAGVWLALALAFGIALSLQRKESDRLQARLNDTERLLASTQEALANRADLSRALEAKLAQLNLALSESTTRLKAADQAADNFGSRPVRPQFADKRSVLAELARAGIPAPLITMVTNAAGAETEASLFPELRGQDLRRLATAVRFSDIHGRRLVFRSSTGLPVAFDVEELHPALLAHLGIDAEAAKRAQAGIDQQKRLRAEAAEKDRRERAEAARKQLEATAKALAEQRKLEEVRLQAQAGQEANRLSAATDHLLALAALRTAEAAYERAQMPYYGWAYPVYTWRFAPGVAVVNQFDCNRGFQFHPSFSFLPPSQYSPAASAQFTCNQSATRRLVQVAQ